LKCTFLH